MKSPRLLFIAVLALALAACSGGHDELNPEDAALLAEGQEAGAGAAALEPVLPQEVEQVVLANDAVMVGSAVGADGAVSAIKPSYAVSDTVYASVPVGGYAPGTEVAIYWFSDKGTSIKNEHKPIPAGAKFVNFSLGKADGMGAGSYTAQVDIGDAPAGLADFTVK